MLYMNCCTVHIIQCTASVDMMRLIYPQPHIYQVQCALFWKNRPATPLFINMMSHAHHESWLRNCRLFPNVINQ